MGKTFSDKQLNALGQLVQSAGGVKTLTEADYNYPASAPTSVALWLLEPGLYSWKKTVKVLANNSGISVGDYGVAGGVVMKGSEYASILLMVASTGNANIRAITRIQNGRNEAFLSVIDESKIDDNLTSTSYARVLSARQGKVLNDKIGGDLSTLTTTDKTSLIAAINEVAENAGGDVPATFTNDEWEALWA